MPTAMIGSPSTKLYVAYTIDSYIDVPEKPATALKKNSVSVITTFL
jgi:hypothetical protein